MENLIKSSILVPNAPSSKFEEDDILGIEGFFPSDFQIQNYDSYKKEYENLIQWTIEGILEITPPSFGLMKSLIPLITYKIEIKELLIFILTYLGHKKMEEYINNL